MLSFWRKNGKSRRLKRSVKGPIFCYFFNFILFPTKPPQKEKIQITIKDINIHRKVFTNRKTLTLKDNSKIIQINKIILSKRPEQSTKSGKIIIIRKLVTIQNCLNTITNTMVDTVYILDGIQGMYNCSGQTKGFKKTLIKEVSNNFKSFGWSNVEWN